MTDTVAYLYGNGGFTLNGNKQTELRTWLAAAGSGFNNLGDGVAIYQYLLSIWRWCTRPVQGW